MIGSFSGDGGSFFFFGCEEEEEEEVYNHFTRKMTNRSNGKMTDKIDESILLEIAFEES